MTRNTKILIFLLVLALTLVLPDSARAEETAIDCECGATDFDNAPACCKQILVWPGEVTGVPCLGPMCGMPDGSVCFCTGAVDLGCRSMCHNYRVAVGLELEAQGAGVRVLPEQGVCFGTEFPFREVAGKPFSELYLEVLKGSGGLSACTQDNALAHWEASWSTVAETETRNQQLWDELLSLNEKLDACLNPPQPRCDTIEDFRDGPGRALWKPVSESTGRVLVLMPHSYCTPVKATLWSNGQKIDTARIRTCTANGNRAHWDFSRECQDYPDDLIVQFDFGEQIRCRTVPKSCVRYD